MPAAETDTGRGTPLSLSVEERELVAAELAGVLPALDGERRRRFEQLGEAVTAGQVPADLTDALASVIELSLQTARARKLYRAEGERILTGVLRRTPRGQELTAQTAAVNQALRALAGDTLTAIDVRMRTIGHFAITITTDGATVTLAVRPDSVNIENVAVHGE